MQHIPAPRHRRRGPQRWTTAAAGLLAMVPLACATDATATTSTDGEAVVQTSTTTTSAPPERLDIVAKEYEWSGLPDVLPVGTYPLTLRNDGTEAHEIQVFENTEHLSLDEVFELGADFAAHVDSAGGAIAGPGSTSPETTLELHEGTYEVVCFIPAAADHMPHFHHGMHRTLRVGS